MEHKTWYHEEDQITYLEFVGDLYKTDIEPLFKSLKSILSGKTNRQLILKMRSDNKVENRETRELSNDGLQKLGLSEIAFIGGSAANRMIAKVLIKTGVVKINGAFFKKNEEAIEWIKSKR